LRQQFTNPWWAILLGPLAAFLLLVRVDVGPDTLNLWVRFYTFTALGYVAARYVGRAPVLMWSRDMRPEARNVVGWAWVCVGFMLNIAYGWIYIAYDRPVWLSSQYWGVAFITLIALGVTIVATSVPRFPPFGNGRNGLSEIASALVVLVSALAVFFVSHIPQAMAVLRGMWSGLVHAF